MHYDVIIVGAGPAGLACAAKLASNNLSILVVERNSTIGKKVCAGGITCSGLLQTVPKSLIEKSFSKQYVYSNLQKISVSEKFPIIATVNRIKLGQYMAKVAAEKGVKIVTSSIVRSIESNKVLIFSKKNNETFTATFSFLVGADGSSSIVRRYLGLPVEKTGFGINYQIAGDVKKMEWHLNSRYFKNGYGWVFPHGQSISIGAYIAGKKHSASQLKKNLCRWAEVKGYSLYNKPCQAGVINYDYRGWQFGNIFLVGDAGGFVSALTGEGIFPAILTGEAAAAKILTPDKNPPYMKRLLQKHRMFSRIVDISGRNSINTAIMAELGVVLLRGGVIKFTAMEMGH